MVTMAIYQASWPSNTTPTGAQTLLPLFHWGLAKIRIADLRVYSTDLRVFTDGIAHTNMIRWELDLVPSQPTASPILRK